MRCSHDCMAVGEDTLCFQNIDKSHFTSFDSILVVNEARLGLRCFSWNSCESKILKIPKTMMCLHIILSHQICSTASCDACFFVLFCRRPVASAYLAFIQRRALSFLPKQNSEIGGNIPPRGGGQMKGRSLPSEPRPRSLA